VEGNLAADLWLSLHRTGFTEGTTHGEAQKILDRATEGGAFISLEGAAGAKEKLREAALEILGDAFPGTDVAVTCILESDSDFRARLFSGGSTPRRWRTALVAVPLYERNPIE